MGGSTTPNMSITCAPNFLVFLGLCGLLCQSHPITSYPSTCSHLVNGSLKCCQTDADCAGCDSEYCACWACGAGGTDVIDGKQYSCDSCTTSPAPPTPPEPAHPNTCNHFVNGTLACCQSDADCAGCEGDHCACWACGADGTGWIDGRQYNCSTCSAAHPSPPTPPKQPNICQHLVNGSLTCCNTDADCGDQGGVCWACPGGSSYVDGVQYQCNSCRVPPPTPPKHYPNICQHLINGTLACCKTNADCGDDGGECWACPDGSSWVDHKYFKCD